MRSSKTARSLSLARWLLFLPIPLLWGLLGHYGHLQFLENRLLDMRFRYRGEIEAPVKLVYVDVDTLALQRMGERPWSRSLFANVAEALIVAGEARAVAFDFVLSKSSSSLLVDQAKAREGNMELRRVILEHPQKVILAAQYTPGTGEIQADEKIREIPLLRKGRTDRSQNDVPEMPETGFLFGPKGPAARVGLIDVDVQYSGDEVPRWVPLFVHTKAPTIYHLSLQTVLQHLGLGETAVQIHDDRIDLVRPSGEFALSVPLHEQQLLETNWFSKWDNRTLNPRRSVSDVFDAVESFNSADEADQKLAREFFSVFKDALVLIGPTDPLLQDLAPTPFDAYPVPKVGLHGNLVKTMLSGRFLQRPGSWATWVAIIGLTLGVSGLAVSGGPRGLVTKIGAVALLTGYVFVGFEVFSRWDYVLPMAAPVGAAFTTSFGAIIAQLIAEEKQKGRIKGMFGAYVSPQLVERMVESGEDPQLGGHDAEITAYFSDIQGFSTFSEKLGSGPLVQLMNEYLTACTDIVTQEGGTLDKYIGDAVVAMFGAPIPMQDHAYRACIASQRVHAKIGELRQKWKREGAKWPEIVWKMQSRIGLNTGVCMIGNMGSRTRFNYTMMGDDVNLAARMESGAKTWGAYTMVTQATKDACEKHGDRVVFRALGRIVVMGRSQPVPIHEIVGLKETVTPAARECVGLFEQALAKYYARDWAAALALFKQSALLEPNQPGITPGVKTNPSLFYAEKVVPDAIEHPPTEDWDGRYIMTEK